MKVGGVGLPSLLPEKPPGLALRTKSWLGERGWTTVIPPTGPPMPGGGDAPPTGTAMLRIVSRRIG